eukprot:4412057-Amphidinium_carterae.2
MQSGKDWNNSEPLRTQRTQNVATVPSTERAWSKLSLSQVCDACRYSCFHSGLLGLVHSNRLGGLQLRDKCIFATF